MNYEFHTNKNTDKLEFSFTGLDFDQAHFIELSIAMKIDKLREHIALYKSSLEEVNGRDLSEIYFPYDSETVGEKIRIWNCWLKDDELLLPKLEEIYTNILTYKKA